MNLKELLQSVGVTAESISRVRLGQGIVGKTTFAVVVATTVLGIIAWNLKAQPWILGGVALIVAVVFLVYFIGVMRFAGKNPGAALLEGAEFLKYQQTEWEAKGILPSPASPRIVDPRGPQSFPPPSEHNG